LFKVRIQQDGAKAHTSKAFMEGWYMMLEDLVWEGVLPHRGKVVLDTQPPNSPDLNINDLGLFNALQAAYYKSAPSTSLELIDCVEQAYREYPWKKINYLWLTLQTVMNQVIENCGGNDYKIPHLNKAKLDREGNLPTCVEVTPFAAGILETMEQDDDMPTVPEDVFEEDIDHEPLPARITRARLEGLLEEN
jgi:hypothetical protein